MTLIMRLVRSEMTEVLNSDYIRFARARGLLEYSINFNHALKNTLVPVITITGLQLGSIIAFAIITETVFQWPGVGLLFIDSVQFVDIPVMAAYLMFISVMFVGINLIVDILYIIIDLLRKLVFTNTKLQPFVLTSLVATLFMLSYQAEELSTHLAIAIAFSLNLSKNAK